MKQLMRINFDYGRMGELNGQWVCTSKQWRNFVKEYKNETIYLYDYLGKHSQIDINVGHLNQKVEIVTDNQDFLNMAEKLNINLNSGWCPFDHEDELDDIKYSREQEEKLFS